MRRITPKIRDYLKKPLGKLVVSGLNAALKGKRVVCVGDITTLKLASIGITPHAVVIDYKYQRRPVSAAQKAKLATILKGRKIYHVKNGAGTISVAAFFATKKAVRGKELSAVVVDGEEDLLTLPAIMSLQKGGAVAYGQPGKGTVVVLNGATSRRRAKNTYDAFT